MFATRAHFRVRSMPPSGLANNVTTIGPLIASFLAVRPSELKKTASHVLALATRIGDTPVLTYPSFPIFYSQPRPNAYATIKASAFIQCIIHWGFV